MANARVSRGRASQVILADWYARSAWPNAESVSASLPGVDIKGMPGLAPEVKATEQPNFTLALRQARRNAEPDGSLPFVVYRPRGFGAERIGEWVVAMDLVAHTGLLLRAGYGQHGPLL